MPDREITCCPDEDCASYNILALTGRSSPVEHDNDYRCRACGHIFDEPDTRRAKAGHGIRCDTAAGVLDQLDPDDLDDKLATDSSRGEYR